VTEQKHEIAQAGGTEAIALPSPTAWPMVLSLGITLVIAGLITHVFISLLGAVLSAIAIVGWFRNVLPEEKHEVVLAPVDALSAAVAAAREPAPQPSQIRRSKLLTYSFLSGIEAGVAGGVAMAVPAVLFSLIRFHSLWYAVNLMAASSFLGWQDSSDLFLSQFHLEGLMVGLAMHSVISLLVGLLYASLLPIFPRLTLLTGGLILPLLWTGLSYELMQSVTPVLGARVNWLWFIASQIVFGVVATLVGSLRVKVRSSAFQSLPFAERAGLHTNESHAGGKHEVKP
jgi:hypothetical protein